MASVEVRQSLTVEQDVLDADMVVVLALEVPFRVLRLLLSVRTSAMARK